MRTDLGGDREERPFEGTDLGERSSPPGRTLPQGQAASDETLRYEPASPVARNVGPGDGASVLPPWPGTLAGAPDPTTFGRFRIVRELGRGGFGVVYLASDPT